MDRRDLNFLSVAGLRALLDRREIGAVELLEHFTARAKAINGRLNAITELNPEPALREARRFDSGLASETRGPLAGIPMTIKESFDLAGWRTTRGVPSQRNYVADADVRAVTRLKNAGALIFGKTNVPLNLADHQSFNEIYGTTVNPWDETRTPGGSSGGGAAALASGMTPIELGGDLGGSIRVPATFCGVFGHKATYGTVPFGRSSFERPETPIDIAVAGPMTRTAADLRMLFSVLAGPDEQKGIGWTLTLPQPPARKLKDFRVAVLFDDADFPVDGGVRGALEAFESELARLGVNVKADRPAIDSVPYHRSFVKLIRAATSRPVPDEVAAAFAAEIGQTDDIRDDEKRGVTISHRAWLNLANERQRYVHLWQSFFENYDVLLCPAMPVPAFPHQQDPDMRKRHFLINGTQHSYASRFFWCSLAGLPYLPATVMPAGFSGHLPVGVQIIGAPYQDYTTLQFAELAEQALGGFRKPAGYS